MDTNRYYYADEKKSPQGPLSRAGLEEYFKDGRISRDTLVIQEGGDEWFPLKNFAEVQARAVTSNHAPPLSVSKYPVSARDDGNSCLARIGQKYSTSIFIGDGFSKSSLALYPDRLEGVGKSYSTASKGKISFSVPLENVSSLGLEYKSHFILLFLGILLLVVLIGFIFLIFYYTTKERYIVVNVQGYPYPISMRGISNNDVSAFIASTLEAMHKLKAS